MSVPALAKFVKMIAENSELFAKTIDPAVFLRCMKAETEPAAIRKAMWEDFEEFATLGKEHGCDFTAQEAEVFLCSLKSQGKSVCGGRGNVASDLPAASGAGLFSLTASGQTFELNRSFLSAARVSLAAGW